jgi:hypothetical protein
MDRRRDIFVIPIAFICWSSSDGGNAPPFTDPKTKPNQKDNKRGFKGTVYILSQRSSGEEMRERNEWPR